MHICCYLLCLPFDVKIPFELVRNEKNVRNLMRKEILCGKEKSCRVVFFPQALLKIMDLFTGLIFLSNVILDILQVTP